MAKRCLRALPRPGYYPLSVYTRGERGDEAVVEPERPPVGHARDLYHVFAAGLRLFPSPRLRRHVLAEADDHVWEHLTVNLVTAQMARSLPTPRSRLWPVDGEFYWTQWGISGEFGAQVACLAYDLTQDPVAAARARDPQALEVALAAWKARRRALGRRVYEGPGIDLARERMDVNGNLLDRAPVDLPREAPEPALEPRTSLGRLPTGPP